MGYPSHYFFITAFIGTLISIPIIILTNHTKNNKTNIGIKHDVTNITANASIKLFNVVSTAFVIFVIPFTIPLKIPFDLLLSSCILSVVSFAPSSVY